MGARGDGARHLGAVPCPRITIAFLEEQAKAMNDLEAAVALNKAHAGSVVTGYGG